MGLEVKEIASTTTRLLKHANLIYAATHGRMKPVTFHLAPTDKCNLECSWCSVRNRDMKELDWEDCFQIIDTYVSLDAKSMELTGGGDPLLYDHLEDVIDYAVSEGLAVGLITNGIALPRVNLDTSKLRWMRISLSGLDFGLIEKYLEIDPTSITTFLGCSYVYSKETTKERLEEVNRVARHLGAQYVRIVPNCNSLEDIEWVRKNAPKRLKRYPNFMLQIKDYKTPPACYWKYVKPFVNSDGFVYQCSTCSLFEGKFPEDWCVGTIEDIRPMYREPLVSFDTSKCPYCFFTDQNQLLSELLVDVKHKEFI